ncbi:hypothetical protein LguiA_009652 [Lonicera macranthoides]
MKTTRTSCQLRFVVCYLVISKIAIPPTTLVLIKFCEVSGNFSCEETFQIIIFVIFFILSIF